MIRTEKLLRDLIALPSVNPAFLPVKHPQAGEKRMAEFLAAIAARAGLDVELQPVQPERSNLIVVLPCAGRAKQCVLFAPHLDTVGVVSEDQFVPRAKNGRLYGRGACDTKGSIASMLAAMMDLAGRKKRPAHTDIVFAGLIDEENAQAGSRALAASGQKAALAIVGEPTRLQVVTAHKGSVWLNLQTRGKAAHGSRPELGRNAVHEMARIVDLLETEYAAKLRARHHRILGHATVSVGSIAGGTQPNIVPAFCAATVDRRTLPGETEASVLAELKKLLRPHRLQATIDTGGRPPCPPLETSVALPLVQQLLEAAGQTKPAGAEYFCDAAVLAEGGIPSVVFGPGDIAQAHTADEWISLASLERGKNLLLNFLKSLT